MKTDELVQTLIDSGTTSSKEWRTLNEELDSKADHYTSEIDMTSKQGQVQIKAINDVKEAKKQEVWAHIANQVLKAVKDGDWRELGKKYTPTPVRRHITQNRNSFIKSFNSKKFWGQLASQSSHDVDKALQAIQNELQKNIDEVNKSNERSF